MHPNQRNGFPCRCEDCERERRDKHAVRTERDTIASQLAEAEATMDAYRGTIGQRERDVAALTAQVAQLEQEKAEALAMPVRTGCDDCLDARRAAEARIISLEGERRLLINEMRQEHAQCFVGISDATYDTRCPRCKRLDALQPASARAPEDPTT